MNVKVFSIVFTCVAALLLVMILVQKNGYASQANDAYAKSSGAYQKYGSSTLEYVSTNIMLSKQVWAVACGVAEKGVKTSSDIKAIERAVAPSVKGSDNFKTLVHRFEIAPSYFIEASFKSISEDKKTNLKTLAGYSGLNISALQGKPTATAVEEEMDEDDEDGEEVVEEAPAPKKAAKGKKGKKRR